MKALALITAVPLLIAGPAFAQHAGHDMPVPMAAPDPTSKPTPTPSAPSGADEPMEAMAWPDTLPEGDAAMPAMPGMDHSAMSPGAGPMAEGEEAAGDAPPPSAPTDHAADRFFDRAAMDHARAVIREEHGGSTQYQVMANVAEHQFRDGEDGYRWDGEAWFGGDINRLVVKSEGEGRASRLEAGEVQALYSRAVGTYFDLRAGVRQDIQEGPRRTYATIGFEGLAPYWFETEGALFLSNEGELLGRLEGTYDLRLAQRWILQPRLEANLSAQDIPELGLGSGLTNLEAGVRLRYELTREFAPYIGVSWDRKFGGSADYARANGDDPLSTSIVIGARAWF